MPHLKRRASTARFDLTPMIDVTFQLLIFFIIATRFKQNEQTRCTHLPEREGVNRLAMNEDSTIEIALQWHEGVMAYHFRTRPRSQATPNSQPILAGSIDTILNKKGAAYRDVFAQLLDALKQNAEKAGSVHKVEISMSLDPSTSSQSHIADTAPWGFVTLVIDVLTRFNLDQESLGQDALDISFKNTLR